MSHRRTILYLFLACSLSTTNACTQPHLPARSDTITIHFDVNQSSLSTEADSILDAYFRNSGGIRRLNITGYCDSTGPEAYNDRLSVDRSIAVRAYLLQYLADRSTVTDVIGYGTRYPISDNRTQAGRALNRRVTINILRAAMPAPKSDTVQTRATARSIYKTLTDSTTRIGTSLILKDVVFFGGRHVPLPISYVVLDDLVKAMQKNDNLRIRIEGHVCCLPDSTDGPDLDTGEPNLSVQRAKAVFDYLIQHGIPKDRITYIGLGASGKLYPEEIGAAQQAANRRVEIRIISK